MTAQLPDTRWMARTGAVAVFDALESAGGTVRFVGGCVRDCFLGRPVGDIDLCTDMVPDTVRSTLENAGIRAVPTGIDYGTVTAVVHGDPVEVTSLRRDVETDGRRAVVSFTTDFREDSLRRDFTINALYADRSGAVTDFHDGIADLAAQRLRFIGDATSRIREDYLRILRFYRFLGQLEFDIPDDENRDACRAERNGLAQLSAERVAMEIRKILGAPNPCPAVAAMMEDGVLDYWLPEASDVDALRCLNEIEFGPDPVLRLAVLTAGATQAADIADRLKLSGVERDRLSALDPNMTAPVSAAQARRLAYRLGPEAARDLGLFGRARGQDEWTILAETVERWTPPSLPVQGRDVLDAGVPTGPDVGRILDRVETYWIESDFEPDRSALMELVREAAKEGGGSQK